MIHSHQYYHYLQLRLQLVFSPVELQTSDTILTPPPILYIHTPQVNNIESHVVLLELDTKFNILRYLLLRIKQPCYFAITDIQIDNIVGGVPVQLK